MLNKIWQCQKTKFVHHCNLTNDRNPTMNVNGGLKWTCFIEIVYCWSFLPFSLTYFTGGTEHFGTFLYYVKSICWVNAHCAYNHVNIHSFGSTSFVLHFCWDLELHHPIIREKIAELVVIHLIYHFVAWQEANLIINGILSLHPSQLCFYSLTPCGWKQIKLNVF